MSWFVLAAIACSPGVSGVRIQVTSFYSNLRNLFYSAPEAGATEITQANFQDELKKADPNSSSLLQIFADLQHHNSHAIPAEQLRNAADEISRITAPELLPYKQFLLHEFKLNPDNSRLNSYGSWNPNANPNARYVSIDERKFLADHPVREVTVGFPLVPEMEIAVHFVTPHWDTPKDASGQTTTTEAVSKGKTYGLSKAATVGKLRKWVMENKKYEFKSDSFLAPAIELAFGSVFLGSGRPSIQTRGPDLELVTIEDLLKQLRKSSSGVKQSQEPLQVHYSAWTSKVDVNVTCETLTDKNLIDWDLGQFSKLQTAGDVQRNIAKIVAEPLVVLSLSAKDFVLVKTNGDSIDPAAQLGSFDNITLETVRRTRVETLKLKARASSWLAGLINLIVELKKPADASAPNMTDPNG